MKVQYQLWVKFAFSGDWQMRNFYSSVSAAKDEVNSLQKDGGLEVEDYNIVFVQCM